MRSRISRLFILPTLFLVCVLPVSARGEFSSVSRQVEPIGVDLYRVTVTCRMSSHQFGAKFEVLEVSDTGDTIVLEPTLTPKEGPHGATLWAWSGSKDVSAPERVTQIEVRSGNKNIVLPLKRRSSVSADTLRTAISHGELAGFAYGTEKIVARPQHIYRVAGDERGSIISCTMPTSTNKTVSRSFYISEMSDIQVNPFVPGWRMQTDRAN